MTFRSKISFSILLFLVSHHLFAQLMEPKSIPRDTSFTPYQAWIKIIKDFPEARIVKSQLPEGVMAENNLVYTTLPDTPFGNRELHLDLFRPGKTGKYPALILIHGGGWRSGNKSMQAPMAQQIAVHGYVTAVVEYRLSPEALYPAAVYNIKAAIRFLRANAQKYNIDPERIAISGSSAGGQLAALIGMTSEVKKFEGKEGNNSVSAKVQAIIDMDGILDFTDPNESAKDDDPAKRSAGAWWFGATFKEAPEKWIEASPIRYAGKDTPPILFINSALPRFHAGRDRVISMINKFGIYSEVHTIPDTPHPFWLFHLWFDPTVEYMLAFLDKTLKANQSNESLPKLEVSANKRYLTSGGHPFFWLGDTGWLLLNKLNRVETGKYLEDRKQKGFNVIQVMLLHTLSAVTANGDSALINKNVATPLLSSTNTKGKTGYWENLDLVIDLAAQKGLYLALVPVWGTNVKAGKVSSRQAEVYAEFLEKRYKGKSNIVWLNGGDVRGSDSTKVWKMIGETLKKFDPGHLISYHPFGRTQSSTWFQNEPWLDFNLFQSGHRRYDQDTARKETRYGEDNWRYVQSDYSKIPVKPTLDGEPSYEGIPQGLHDTLQPRWTDSDVRRYAYWSVFSGGCGFTYGNNSVMQFYKSGNKPGDYGARESWVSALNNPGAKQLIYLKNLMLKYHFEDLVPDQPVFSDEGERYNHLAALRGKNGLLVYTYNGRKIRLKMDHITGSDFNMYWFSPQKGTVIKTGSFKKGEVPEFDPPGIQENGNDWVLILESNSSQK